MNVVLQCQNKNRIALSLLWTAFLVLFWGILSLFIAPPALHAQVPEQVDPFYVNLLEEGKSLCLKSNLEGSAKCLEIAFFGYLDYPAKVLECYVYLLIDYYGLKNTERADYFRGEIRRLNLGSRLADLSLPKEIKSRYDEINAAFSRVEAYAARRLSGVPAAPQPPVPTTPPPEVLPDDVPSLIKLAESSLAGLLYEKVDKAMMKALKLDNENVEVRYYLGRADFGLRRYKEASAEFEFVLARSPRFKDAEAWKKACANMLK